MDQNVLDSQSMTDSPHIHFQSNNDPTSSDSSPIESDSAHALLRRRHIPKSHPDTDKHSEPEHPSSSANRRERSSSQHSQSLIRKTNIRGDGYGGGGDSHHSTGGMTAFQSLNYHPDESQIWRSHVAAQNFHTKNPQWWKVINKLEFKRWVIAFCIGVVQALIAFACGFCVRNLTRFKFDAVNIILQGVDKEESDSEDLSYRKFLLKVFSEAFAHKPFLAYLFFQLFYVFIANMCVWVEPASGGSGISEIKCYLNGVNVPRYFDMKTLVCKIVGVTFGVSAGLPIGKEGPMFHSGAIVAALVAQSKIFCIDFSSFAELRNDQEKRDFITCGAAAGVASAFASPIGGVLLSLEEGASFWSTKVTWRAFFCAMISLGTLLTISSWDITFGPTNIEQLFSFGEFGREAGDKSKYAIWELLLFMVVGCIGGLLGAIFNEFSERLVAWRMRTINKKKIYRTIEIMAIMSLISTLFYCIPLIWNKCTPLPTDIQGWDKQEQDLVHELVPFQCKEGKEYNEVASLIFTDADNAMKQLLHSPDGKGSSFSSAALFLFFVPYFIMATLVYGTAVPSGLFVPSLLAGAGFGRMCGHLLNKLSPDTFSGSGTYALMGAAAMLGGMARMTISITVILLEVTGDMEFVVPLMLTLLCARFAGNVFNESVYDILIHLKHIPFLEPDVPHIVEKNDMVAGQVMNTSVKILQPVEKAGTVYDLMKTCSHAIFPVVDMANNGTLYGTVSRDVLCTLLQRRAFGKPYNPEKTSGPRRLSPLVTWDTIEDAYPEYPTIDDVLMRHMDRERTLDLRPYANTAPYTINETASIQRTYRLFRTLGLRFLCVVNYSNKVVGVITRKDLLPTSLSNALLRGRLAHFVPEDEHSIDPKILDTSMSEIPNAMLKNKKKIRSLIRMADYTVENEDDNAIDSNAFVEYDRRVL